MTDELKPCLAYPCEGYMKPNNYDAALECSSCQFVVADESEYDALVAGRQQAIDAALIDLIQDLGSLYIHRNGHELYNGAIDDVARFIKGQLGTNPLAERDARIAELERELSEQADTIIDGLAKRRELERELAEARKDAGRWRFAKHRFTRAASVDMSGRHTYTFIGRTIGRGLNVDEAIDAAMRQEGE